MLKCRLGDAVIYKSESSCSRAGLPPLALGTGNEEKGLFLLPNTQAMSTPLPEVPRVWGLVCGHQSFKNLEFLSGKSPKSSLRPAAATNVGQREKGLPSLAVPHFSSSTPSFP